MATETLSPKPSSSKGLSESIRSDSMNGDCSIPLMDQALVQLFRQVVQDDQADLCSVLSSRHRALSYTAHTPDKRFEVSLTPDSPHQRINVAMRHGDVHYEFSRSFGLTEPYGGTYQGVKYYAELGAVPIADSYVKQLLDQWLNLFQTHTPWEHTLQILSPVV